MKVISVDPSSKLPAYALWENGKLTYYGQMPFQRYSKTSMWNWYSLFKDVAVLIIERQYMGINAKSLITLSKSVGAIEALAVMSDTEIKEIMATTWQSKLLGGRLKRPQLKRLSKERASELVGERIVSDDIADAILIGEFYQIYMSGRRANER